MDLSGRNLPNAISHTNTLTPKKERENRKWARTILKCLIGVNNLWVEVFKMLCVCVCHLIPFHILICIIFEVLLVLWGLEFWMVAAFFLDGWRMKQGIEMHGIGTDDTFCQSFVVFDMCAPGDLASFEL